MTVAWWSIVFVALFLCTGGLIRSRKTQYKWIGKCACPNLNNHRPTCYASMKWHEVGITLPEKYNYADNEWKDPSLEEWQDQHTS